MQTGTLSIDRVQIQQILIVLQQAICCPLDEVTRLRPELRDDSIFLAINHLSQNSQVFLMRDADGTY